MKILIISDVYFPRVNGVSTSIKIFRESLAELGFQSTLIAPEYNNRTCSKTDVNVVRIRSKYLFLDPEDRALKAGEIFKLETMLQESQFDLIHVQTPFIAHYSGIRLARRLRLPVVETYHTYFEEYLFYYVPFLPKSLLRGAARLFSRLQCNQVDAVIAPSRAMADVLRGYGVRKPIAIIPTGLDLDEFDDGCRERFCRCFGIDAGRPILVYVGRVAHEKNISFLLEVVRLVRRVEPDVLLVIAGEGPARKSLQDQTGLLGVQHNVLFVDYLPRGPALWDCFCAGDVFVFASSTETQGLVLLEAMALGVPVVSTAAMGTSEIVNAGKGVIVAKASVEDFADKVLGILHNEVLRSRLSIEGKRHAREWSAGSMALKMAHLYAGVVGARPEALNCRC